MQVRQIAVRLLAVLCALLLPWAPMRAAEHIVDATFDAEFVPELLAGETAGDFILAYATREGVHGHPFVDGSVRPSQSLLPMSWYGGFASARLAHKPGRGLLLAFAQTAVRGAPLATQSAWVRPLNASLSGPAPREVHRGEGTGLNDVPAEMDVLADTRDGACCHLLASTFPRVGSLRLSLVNAQGVVLARRDLPTGGTLGTGARRPALAYQSDAGFFVVAYETRRDIRVRLVYPTVQSDHHADFKWISEDRVLAVKTQPARYEDLVDGHPHIAYSPELRQFLVTWLDHTHSSGDTRRVMARALTRAGVPTGSSFVVQTSCPPTSWSCHLLRPVATGAPRVFAMPGGFHLSFAASTWSTTSPLSGVLGHRLTASGSGFTLSSRWLSDRSDARILHLRTAYDPRSGIAAAAWVASAVSPGDGFSIATTELRIGDFLP